MKARGDREEDGFAAKRSRERGERWKRVKACDSQRASSALESVFSRKKTYSSELGFERPSRPSPSRVVLPYYLSHLHRLRPPLRRSPTSASRRVSPCASSLILFCSAAALIGGGDGEQSSLLQHTSLFHICLWLYVYGNKFSWE